MTRDEINAAVAKAKGWTYGVAPCSFKEDCDTPHWRDADGLNAMNALPDFLTPAASWALLAEMVAANAVLMRSPRDKVVVELGDTDTYDFEQIEMASTLEEAVALAWLAWKESQA